MRNTDTPVIAVAKSGNAKTGQVAATYASQASCPSGCSFRGSGCYAESGVMNIHTIRLNDATIQGQIAIATIEANAIRRLPATSRLRLHVVGDCSTDATALIVSQAASEYHAKHGEVVWSYTHAWRSVARESWRDVSINASCETGDDLALAKSKGYSTVVVYGGDLAVKPFTLTDSKGTAHKIIPCPQQLGRNNCADCKGLCADAESMRAHNITVGFHAHGAKSASVDKVLAGLSA